MIYEKDLGVMTVSASQVVVGVTGNEWHSTQMT